jgi:hypothetical protein
MLNRSIPYVIILVLLLAMYHEGCKTGQTMTRSDTVVSYDTITRSVATRPRLVHTYRNDTIVIRITDTISRNSIQGRSVAYTLRLPTRTITNTITERRAVTGLYLTPYASQDRTIGIGATYVAPRWLGSVGYGTNGVQVGIGVKIGR